MKTGLAGWLVSLVTWCGVSVVSALPTPKWDEGRMEAEADLVVEGSIERVTLLRRWIGDRAGIDAGYERGEFESRLLVEKVIKGDAKERQVVRYFVSAYMEGKWDDPPAMGFVYEGTRAAVTPGTKLRAYLKWNAEAKRYERVHFNSGFVVLRESGRDFPRSVAQPGRNTEELPGGGEDKQGK